MKPVILNRGQLIDVVTDILNGINSGDTLEGSVEFLMNLDGDSEPRWNVQASYRVGNLNGQGGLRLVGEVEDLTGSKPQA